ncbi:MAG: ribosome silencing factor [Acidiferrobacteraceae bacterium]
MQPRYLLKKICTVLDQAKGLDIKSLDVRKMTDIADYMVIASGTSSRHVNALADRLVDQLRTRDVRPVGVEGREQGEWVLIDFADVIVHVMLPQTRDFYNLEKLWSKEVAEEPQRAEKVALRPRRRTRT